MADPTPERPPKEIGHRICPVCGRPLTGGQRSACSDRCRAIKSQRRRAEKQAARDQQVAAYLLTAQEALGAAQETMKGR